VRLPAYERRTDKLLPWDLFRKRMIGHAAIVVALTVVSLAVGMAGYMFLEHLSALESFLNSAMLLGGMGPVDNPVTDGGKLFAGLYALFAGLFFLVAAALLLAPVFHRVLHRFHVEGKA
jgi:hypothetical protein